MQYFGKKIAIFSQLAFTWSKKLYTYPKTTMASMQRHIWCHKPICLSPAFRFCGLVILFFWSQQAFAQYLPSNQWSTGDGLSNNWVSDILEDSRGFIWIGTQYGVNKFDGYDFQHYCYDPDDTNSLTSNWVRSIAEDADGKLWFGLYGGGLVHFDPLAEKFERISKERGVPGNEIYKVLATERGEIWVATGNGVAWCVPGGAFTKVFDKRTFEIREDGQGRIWLGSEDGLYFVPEDGYDPKPVADLKGPVYSLHPDGDEKLWVFTKKGLELIDKQSGEFEPTPILLSKIDPNRYYFPFVFEDSQSKLWTGISEKLFTGGKNRAFQEFKGLPEQNLHCIAEDHNGNIWIGTNNGFFRIPSGYGRFQQKPSLSFFFNYPKVREVIGWEEELWYADPNGLYVWDRGDTNRILESSINSLLKSERQGLIYAGPSDNCGIFEINPETRDSLFLSFPGSENDPTCSRKVWGLVEDQSGCIWVGAQGRLYRLDPEKDTIEAVTMAGTGGELNSFFIDLKIDREGHLWAGTLENGLIKIKIKNLHRGSVGSRIILKEGVDFKLYKHDANNPYSLSSNLVVAIFADQKDGKIWVGTDGGLNCLDPIQADSNGS